MSYDCVFNIIYHFSINYILIVNYNLYNMLKKKGVNIINTNSTKTYKTTSTSIGVFQITEKISKSYKDK